MTRIICAKCKNAFLGKADGNLTCPSCEAVFSEKDENLFAGIQYYTEGNYESANDCLMKYIVQEGAEPRAMFYKALCDATEYDEDTSSLKGLYEKLLESLGEISDQWFIEYLAMANDEVCKIEKSVADKHIALFEDADAEKIKKEVTTIITLQNDAKEFRNKLTDLAYEYNNRAENTISVRFSECFLVEPDIAEEVGNRKYEKILGNIASHTVFTGSLSTDIKNLEIYYRCIVMFFRRNRQKYDFLMASAEKFSELSKRLEEGQYNTIKGTSTIGDKLKSAAYDFFQESLKDHDEDEELLQKETILVHEPEIIEIPEATEDVEEVVTEEDTVDAEAPVEYEDISSTSSDDDDTAEASEPIDEDIIDVESSASDEKTEETADAEDTEVAEEVSEDTEVAEEASEDATEEADEEANEDNTVESEESDESDVTDYEAEVIEIADISDELIDDEKTIEANFSSAPSTTATLTKIDKANVDVIPDDTSDEDEAEEALEEAPADTKPVRKHKKHYAPFIAIILIILAIAAVTAIRVIPPKLRAEKYAQASEYAKNEQYDKAAELYSELGAYEDSQKLYLENTYAYAAQLESHGRYAEAKAIYEKLGAYSNSAEKVNFCIYNDAIKMLDEGKFDEAKKAFDSIAGYKDSATLSAKCLYKKAESLIANHNFKEGVEILETITSYDETVSEMILDAQYKYVNEHLTPDDETTMIYITNLANADYKDSVSLRDYLVEGQVVTPPDNTPTPDDTVNPDDSTSVDTPADNTVLIFTNSDKSDAETNATEFDSDRAIYIHIDCLDESLYGQELTMTYENKYSKANLKKNTFTAEDTSYVFTYSGDGTRNYDITFRLIDAEGNVVAEQTVSVK